MTLTVKWIWQRSFSLSCREKNLSNGQKREITKNEKKIAYKEIKYYQSRIYKFLLWYFEEKIDAI